ncbi:DNA-directed RNA polymerase subunit beta [Rhynchospora pubera]|uniref:DNA-directed RNA polymerase subunit beta n=1 Tax=Rhynchospora pubera TaxID=906938 RepID=A0AAV8DR11_9POAL|nr:DNA-directed RNA polymerase subunit beta [Rhynchospora pubera]
MASQLQHHFNSSPNLLAAPVKSPVDKFQLLPAFLKVRGLVKQHIDSFNYFVNHGIKKIMKANALLEVTDTIYLRYVNIYVGEPYLAIENKLTPQFCRLSDSTYSADISVDIEYSNGKDKLRKFIVQSGVKIGRLPIMLRSCNCVLNGKDETELTKLGECPLDPGGYFVVKGTEKVILIQEQLSKNRIMIGTGKNGRVAASIFCSTPEVQSKTEFIMDNEKIYLKLNQFEAKNGIPIMVVMKAMGIESDQEVVQIVGRDPRYADLLLPSIQECSSERVYSQEEALDYMDARAKYVPYAGSVNPEKRKEGRAKSILTDSFLAHVPVKEGNLRPKCIYSAVMLRRMLDAVLNADTFDDKDYVGNKRLELSGQLVSLLFEDLFKTMNNQAVKGMREAMARSYRSGSFDFSRFIMTEIITHGLEMAISTGNWRIGRFKMDRPGISQVLSRLSYIGALGHMTRITPQFEKTRKVSGPRALQPSQWGMLCPCDTPEGESCGLTKNLALMTHVTTDEEEGPLIRLCYSLGVEDLAHLSGEEIHAKDSYLVFFNGAILGKHTRPHIFANAIRRLRRSGKIGEFVSIFVHEKQNCIYMAADGGRVCRPLIIADNGISRVKDHHLKELQVGFRNFDDFLHDGLIEYLDVNEHNNVLIALYEHEVGTEKVDRSAITHIEIEPLTILGVVAGLIPYPHHNQSPRNTYQCAMGKQAMGNIAYNQLCRADTLLYLLVYAQRPLLTTKTIELVGYDKLGAGQNATVAIMSYSGYDIEDAIVMNKSSLDRGFGRCIALKKKIFVKDNYGGKVSDIILAPQKDKDGALIKQNMQILDADGIAAPGQIVRNYDMLLHKYSPVNLDKNAETRDTSAFYKDGVEGETTVIDRVILYKDSNDKMPIKFIIRHTRRPEVGDKFSSRHGQKGVCGTIVQQEDFPFSERGICPDLIMNPHGFPSRMTIGKMIELLGGKAGVSLGRFHYGSAFGEPSGHADKVEDISNVLIERGFSYNGKDFLYSGILGTPLQAYIFMGPIYYQKLKHMVLDKIHARANGQRVLLTRQPTEGRGKQGGLRLGEMERDCLIAYGASMLIYERLMLSSDPYEVQVCQKCGLLGYYNKKLKKSFCSMCKNGENMATMKLPYACKLLFQELQSMNVVPRLKLTDNML